VVLKNKNVEDLDVFKIPLTMPERLQGTSTIASRESKLSFEGCHC
jgi:hypothetical protein